MDKSNLNLHIVTGIEEFQDLFNSPDVKAMYLKCMELCESTPLDKEGKLRGYCVVCDETVEFVYDWQYTSVPRINFRERMNCSICELNNRQRGIANVIFQVLEGLYIPDMNTSKTTYQPDIQVSSFKKTIYFCEQVTPMFKALFDKMSKTHNIIGSEFLGYDIAPGEVINEIRNENALELSFDDESLDMIVSNDVLEHIPDINVALQEAYRTLKEDGHLVFTIPFHSAYAKSKQRAQILNGYTHHIEEAMYHANPVIPDAGSLVFYDFGWDIFDMCKKAGFSSANMVAFYDADFV